MVQGSNAGPSPFPAALHKRPAVPESKDPLAQTPRAARPRCGASSAASSAAHVLARSAHGVYTRAPAAPPTCLLRVLRSLRTLNKDPRPLRPPQAHGRRAQLTVEGSRLSALPGLGTSALGSVWEGSANGSEWRLLNSLPVQGSPGLGATAGALGMGRGSHDSPRRLAGTGGSLSLGGQSPGVQGRGRL